MFSAVNTGGIRGMDAYPVRVEVDLSRGLPCFELVGSAGSEVKEARERVQIALKNEGMVLPVSKITVNLSPADIRKEGTGYDLPIAAGLLACMGVFHASDFLHTAFLGELALNGEVRRINGVLPIVIALKKEGMDTFLVPAENAGECAAVPGIRTVGIRSVGELLCYLKADEEERQKRFPTYERESAGQVEGFCPSVRTGKCKTGGRGGGGRLSPFDAGRSAGDGKNHDCGTDSRHSAAYDGGGKTGGVRYLQHCRKTADGRIDGKAAVSCAASYRVAAGNGRRRTDSPPRAFVSGTPRHSVFGRDAGIFFRRIGGAASAYGREAGAH